ncbi:MAG UNVERIFIED_CONTAM: hypothetical protein LVR29_26225 [Microcystis novacekii LVE1205-3]
MQKIALLFGAELEGDEIFKVLTSSSNKVSLLNFSGFGVTAIIAPGYLLTLASLSMRLFFYDMP